MKINSFKILQIASEVNQMNSKELEILSECLTEKTSEKLSDYISFSLQEKNPLNIEVQEPVC